MTPSGALADFLLARIAEDEARAQAALERNGAQWTTYELSDGTRITGTTEFGNPRSYRGDSELWSDEGALGMFAETAAHIARHDPARVLAECDAKRRIVQDYLHEVRDYRAGYTNVQPSHRTVKHLALPYADHPDYHDEWRS